MKGIKKLLEAIKKLSRLPMPVVPVTSDSYKPVKSYNELLADSRWIAKRNRILDRDNHRCCMCHRSYAVLHVHHKYYSKVRTASGQSELVCPWDYPDDALVTLCKGCHEQVHKTRQIKTYWRKQNEHYK